MIHAFSSLLPTYVWIILSSIILTVGDVLFRIYQSAALPRGFIILFLIYVVGVFCMVMSFFGENIAIATIISIIFNCIAYLIVSYLLFGDTLTPLQICGIGFGFISIGIMTLS